MKLVNVYLFMIMKENDGKVRLKVILNFGAFPAKHT